MSEETERPDRSGLRILITNAFLMKWTGTETFIQDLAPALMRHGHKPMVYTPMVGAMADEIRAAGVPVYSRIQDIPEAPDIIHGHHREALDAMRHFPGVPAIYVCHARHFWQEVPPYDRFIFRYVAVDYNTLDRLRIAPWVRKEQIRVILNSFDPERFPVRPPLPVKPKRALVFSNYARPDTHRGIREACEEMGIELDFIGFRMGITVREPEKVLGNYDIVFAKARCAIEAMATGAAVIMCDTKEISPMVTTKNFHELRPWNFGMRRINDPLEIGRIKAEIRRYDPEDAAKVCALIREVASLEKSAAQYIELYNEVLDLAEEMPALSNPLADTLYRAISWVWVMLIKFRDDLPVRAQRLKRKLLRPLGMSQ